MGAGYLDRCRVIVLNFSSNRDGYLCPSSPSRHSLTYGNSAASAENAIGTHNVALPLEGTCIYSPSRSGIIYGKQYKSIVSKIKVHMYSGRTAGTPKSVIDSD